MNAGSYALPTRNSSRSKAFSLVLRVGFIAGTLDITEDLVFNQFRGIAPTMVFQYIASGLIGVKSFHGGLASAALGMVLHYVIALTWTGVFYAVSRKFASLGRRPVIWGLLYGSAVYLFMNLIVLPLSGVPHTPSATTTPALINGVLAVIVCIGLAISLLVSAAGQHQ